VQPLLQPQHAQHEVAALLRDSDEEQQPKDDGGDDDDAPIVIDSSDDDDDEAGQALDPIPPLQDAGAAAALAVPGAMPGGVTSAEAYIAAVAGHAPTCVQQPTPSSLASGAVSSWQAVEAEVQGRLAALQGQAVGRRNRHTGGQTVSGSSSRARAEAVAASLISQLCGATWL
jgi:hypothetical protein